MPGIDLVPCYWIVETATNKFLRGGIFRNAPTAGAGETLVTLPTDAQIDPVTMRYDSAAPSKTRPLTPAEVTADLAARRDSNADSTTNRAELAAMLEFVLRRILGRNPTPAERQAARTEYRNILRNILDT